MGGPGDPLGGTNVVSSRKPLTEADTRTRVNWRLGQMSGNENV